LDVHYHRGANQNYLPTVSDGTLNPKQDFVTKAVKQYVNNQIGTNEFRSVLRENECEIDTKMATLIRRQEAGDTVSFNEMGKHALRSMNGSGVYNRVDKISMTYSAMMHPENTGKNYHKHQEID
jgi:hypothetical protein